MISSKDNSQFKELKSLFTNKGRQKLNRYVIEGKKIISEAIRDGQKLITYGPNKDVEMANFLIKSLSDLEVSDYEIASAPIINYQVNLANENKILILDAVNDPGNVGTLLRSALAFDYKTIYYHQLDIYNPKIVRSARNAHHKLKLIKINNLNELIDELKAHQIKLINTKLHSSSIEINELKNIEKHALILGNEANGVSELFDQNSDINLIIKISDEVESLNVAVAGSIIMHHLSKE